MINKIVIVEIIIRTKNIHPTFEDFEKNFLYVSPEIPVLIEKPLELTVPLLFL